METKTPVYVGSNGRATPIDKMADTYLVNVIRKIERQMAADQASAERANNLGANLGVPLGHPLYPDLLAELKRRPQQAQDWYVEWRSKGS